MIIQCRKCETRFRFDEALIQGDGVWVRCSRCRHLFFEERSANRAAAVPPDLPAAAGPEIPTVRISDTRRYPEDPFSAAGERAKRLETAPEPMSTGLLRTGRETETGFSREPQIGGLGADFGKEILADPPASEEEKESVEMVKEALARLVTADEPVNAAPVDEDEEEAPSDEGERTGWGRTLLKLFALLIFIAVVAGAVYLYLFPEVRTGLMNWMAPRLQGIPVLENLVTPPSKGPGAAPAPVLLKEIRQRSVSNLLIGNLRVVEGVAVNQTSSPLSRIRVRLVIADANDVALTERVVYCGNLLTDSELGTLAEAEILRELSIEQGSDVANERIAPNGTIPFMIVFNQEQAGAVKITVNPAGADPLP